MIIGNIGWSGNKNWGDERMLYCLRRFFKHDNVVPFCAWQDAIDRIDELNNCDFILFGGGGLFFRETTQFARLINEIKKPFGCVGVSIEADKLHDDMKQGYDLLLSKSKFVYVRDKASKAILGGDKKVIVGPDITFLYPFAAESVRGNKTLLNLRSWPWWDSELYSFKDELFKKLNKHISDLDRIYPFRKWDSDRLVQLLMRSGLSLSPIPFYYGQHGVKDSDFMAKYFDQIPSTYSIKQFHGASALIAMRLHALIFATQLGIPFISLSYEPKNLNYCTEIGIPELSLDLKDHSRILEKMKYLEENRQEIRKQMLDYRKDSKVKVKNIFSNLEKIIRKYS